MWGINLSVWNVSDRKSVGTQSEEGKKWHNSRIIEQLERVFNTSRPPHRGNTELVEHMEHAEQTTYYIVHPSLWSMFSQGPLSELPGKPAVVEERTSHFTC